MANPVKKIVAAASRTARRVIKMGKGMGKTLRRKIGAKRKTRKH
jgi:hypothetical protein